MESRSGFELITRLLRVPLEGNPIPLSERWKGGCLSREPLPNLVPHNPDGITNFCDLLKNKVLRIHVKNQGDGAAEPSITRITFERDSPTHGEALTPIVENIPTPHIEPEGIVTLCVPTPDPEQGWNRKFKIEVNAGEPPIAESDIENHVAEGSCPDSGLVIGGTSRGSSSVIKAGQ